MPKLTVKRQKTFSIIYVLVFNAKYAWFSKIQ